MSHKSISNLNEADVSALLAHKDLVSLEFTYCDAFPDLTPLSELENLTDISIKYCNRIVDLSFLKPLTKLKKLSVRECYSLVDVSVLQYFENLISLKLISLTALKDISSLKKLAELRSLSLSGSSSISDLTPLANFKYLNQLKVNYSLCLVDISCSTLLDTLTELTINDSNQKTNFPSLGKFNRLQKLTIHNCGGYTDIGAIAEVKELTDLQLHFLTNVSCLEPLSGLEKLKTLTVRSGINVKSLEPIGKLTQLTSLELYDFKLVDDITPLGKLKNLTSLSFQRGLKLRDINALAKLHKLERLDLSECVSVADVSPIGELGNLKRLVLNSCYSVVDLNPTKGIKYVASDYEHSDLEKYKYEDLQDSIYGNCKLIKFARFKSSLESFHLDEFESYVECEFDKQEHHPFNSHSTSLLYSTTSYRRNHPSGSFVCFEIIDIPVFFDRYPFHAWLAVGPSRIRNETKYRYFEELEVASKAQIRTLIIDGFMSAVEERYFWCAKLIAWIEDNCHAYEADIENTMVELMAFYMIDGFHSDDYDSTGFSYHFIHAITMLADAANKDISFETMCVMQDHISTYFSSYSSPSRSDLQDYAQQFKWEIIQSQLDEVYGDNNDDLAEHKQPTNCDHGKRQPSEYSERFLQVADAQATRVSDRAFRAIQIMIENYDRATEQVVASSLRDSIKDIHDAIANMSSTNAEVYTEKLLVLINADQTQCLEQINNIFKELNIK